MNREYIKDRQAIGRHPQGREYSDYQLKIAPDAQGVNKMRDDDKTKKQLIVELKELRQQGSTDIQHLNE